MLLPSSSSQKPTCNSCMLPFSSPFPNRNLNPHRLLYQFPLLNYGVCNNLTFTTKECCLQRISFRCQIVLSIANQFSLLNCVVCSKSVFTVKFCLSAANQFFTAELCSLQRISFRCWIVLSSANRFSLPNCGVRSESVFTAALWCQQQIVSAVELWCQQRIRFRCRIMKSPAN
jgi:hypothetical protein